MEEMSGEGGSSPAGREAVGTDGVPHRAERVLVFTCGPMGKKQPPSHSQAATSRVLECFPPILCTHRETDRVRKTEGWKRNARVRRWLKLIMEKAANTTETKDKV